MSMRILITGAHLTPALAVIEDFKKYPDLEIVYVGRKTTREGDSSPSAESQILPKMGVKFIPIITGRLQKALSIYTIPSFLKIPIGFSQAIWIILKLRPDVVLSFGGYVSVPVVIVSWLFSIPVILHEQTLAAGLANKISSIFANKIAISFPKQYPYPSSKVVVTGNPIRQEIQNSKRSSKHHLPLILITGGNQGSHAINLAVEDSLNGLVKIAQVIHQTGDSKYRDFERLKLLESGNYSVAKWIDNMGQVMAEADLVVSRAGMNTLTELAYLKKPALLIPFPYLYKDEQNVNANYFAKTGMVKILPQSKLSGPKLLNSIKEILKDLTTYRDGAKKANELIIKNGAEKLALETTLLVNT